MRQLVVSLIALAACVCTRAQTPVPADVGLYNTGTLVGSTNPYTLQSAPAGFQLYFPSQTAWPLNSVWIDNTASVQWLSFYSGTMPTGTTSVPTAAAGDYTIRLNFDLASYVPETVNFGFSAAADNTLSVLLNGTAQTNTGTLGGSGVNYDTLAHYVFDVSGTGSGLHGGANYLDFVVNNSTGATSNPAGLYVSFNSFTGTVIPEPSTYALALGALTFGFVFWRRRR